AGHLPEALPHLARGRALPADIERPEAGRLGPLDHQREVVPTDVVSSDHVRVFLEDLVHEPLEDLPLRAVEAERGPWATPAFRDPADCEDGPLPDGVFDVER